MLDQVEYLSGKQLLAKYIVDYNKAVIVEEDDKVGFEKERVIVEEHRIEVDIDFGKSFCTDFEELVDWGYNGC